MTGTSVTDPASHLRLVASAVARRPVGVATSTDERAWSDGETIFVSGDDQRDAVILQAALIAVGSFAPTVVVRMTGRRLVRSRYLTLEALRASHALRGVLPRHIVGRIAEVYDAAPPESPDDSLRRASSREKVPDPPPWFGTLKPSQVFRNAGFGGGSQATQQEREQGVREDMLRETNDEEDSERSKILELFSAPMKGNALTDAIQKFFGTSGAPDPDGSGGEEQQAAGSRVGRVGENGQPASTPQDFDLGLFLPLLGRSYPEWDYRKARYKPDHCFVEEFDPRVPEELGALDDGNDPRLRRALARLGLAHERRRREPHGDALDMTALTEYVVDRALGAPADDRVYELTRRTAHDLGVVVLLDMTGSTADEDGASSVFDDQRQVAARLIATLDELGDRVAGYGFQSYGRSVRFLRIKEFDDRWDMAAQRRLASMEPGGFTRLGAAVRHGAYLASECSGCINTLLIVVGDGLPYDDGYEDRYAEADSARALSEAVDAGVGCACLSVKTGTEPDVLERVWGHVPYIHLGRVGDLHRQVTPVFRRGLHEASRLGADGRR